jgi:hypothetical protein
MRLTEARSPFTISRGYHQRRRVRPGDDFARLHLFPPACWNVSDFILLLAAEVESEHP